MSGRMDNNHLNCLFLFEQKLSPTTPLDPRPHRVTPQLPLLRWRRCPSRLSPLLVTLHPRLKAYRGSPPFLLSWLSWQQLSNIQEMLIRVEPRQLSAWTGLTPPKGLHAAPAETQRCRPQHCLPVLELSPAQVWYYQVFLNHHTCHF